MSSANSDKFTSFPLMLFISFSCLIALARTFSTLLRVVKRAVLFLFLILEIRLSPCAFYYVEVHSLYTHNSSVRDSEPPHNQQSMSTL